MTFPPRTTSLAATATAAVASLIAYPFLPRRVATHFDADGRADRYSSRAAAALTLPAVMAALMSANRRLGAWPGSGDREDSASGAQAREEAIGLIEVALLPAHLAVLANGVGLPVDMSRIPRVVYGVLMIAVGNVMPKLPRNGLIGIRTPWTLTDPVVWERTHRVGGYLVTAAGLVTLASLPANGKRAERLSRTAILGAVGLSAGYSFVLYRRRKRSHR
jgi:immunity protein, SdpI family